MREARGMTGVRLSLASKAQGGGCACRLPGGLMLKLSSRGLFAPRGLEARQACWGCPALCSSLVLNGFVMCLES